MTVPVVCGIIVRDEKVFCVERGPEMRLAYKWEFPGGKVEQGEAQEDALIRELEEELGVTVKPLLPLHSSKYIYEHVSVELIPFVCVLVDGEIDLREHSAEKWLSHDELSQLDWAEADKPIVKEVKRRWDEIRIVIQNYGQL